MPSRTSRASRLSSSSRVPPAAVTPTFFVTFVPSFVTFVSSFVTFVRVSYS
jgi:hypothetical protein